MRLVAFLIFFFLLLASGNAAAFDCAGVTFPPTVVLCSDPELMRLADERQAAINAARARIGELAWPSLWENQKRWVRSYATACGIVPDRPPPDPVPVSIIACFRHAGMARIEYLQNYGLPNASAAVAPAVAASADRHIGPSFDCGKAASALTVLICDDAALSRVDLTFNQAYWALYQGLGVAEQSQLREEDIAFIDQVQGQCGLLVNGPVGPQAQQSRDCVASAYEKMREAWIARLSGIAREEAVRAPAEHVKLQQDLQQLGFLSPGHADGVYGRDTRAAITAWQSARGRDVTGFLSNADALVIEHEVVATPIVGTPVALGSDDIPLERDGGVYTVPVRINGVLTLSFTIDSGASDVVIPADVALTLWRTGTISDQDFIGEQRYALADGSTLKSTRFLLHELKVGNLILTNIAASIGSVKSELLLGQSFLSKLASWSIDNQAHVLRLSGLNR